MTTGYEARDEERDGENEDEDTDTEVCVDCEGK
jgi:hypothetical protein